MTKFYPESRVTHAQVTGILFMLGRTTSNITSSSTIQHWRLALRPNFPPENPLQTQATKQNHPANPLQRKKRNLNLTKGPQQLKITFIQLRRRRRRRIRTRRRTRRRKTKKPPKSSQQLMVLKDQYLRRSDEVEKPTLTNHEERWLLKLLNKDEGFQLTTEYFKDSELTGRQIFIILLYKVSVMGQKHFNDKRAVLARKL